MNKGPPGVAVFLSAGPLGKGRQGHGSPEELVVMAISLEKK